ncbi:MAG: beta-ketoacyl-[acyl-carrier-protein] synthase family protein [Hydrogenophaga sp.]|jgi:3-oxoacyl-[acyl-carrier-protein] synthase II|nr:beta-ketoacyl-[acyl-carrier-protein] synthase family protein [Hydrogenophaga sp.]
MSQRRVAVTGLGLVSPYGGDLADFFARLSALESAVAHHTIDDPKRPFAVPLVCCAAFDAAGSIGKPLASMTDRFAQLALGAAFSAWTDAGLPRQPQPGASRDGWGVSWGSAVSAVHYSEKIYRDLWQEGRERMAPLSVLMGMGNAANAHLSIQLGLGGVSMTHSVACASSAISIGEAFRRVRSGEAEVMLCGGSDAPQTYGVMRAWEALRVLAPGDGQTASVACRPFASDRRGLVLGEGAAALVLEDWAHAQARGAAIHAELVGFGTTCDHTHLVKPEVSGQARALRLALADAALAPEAVDYVNAHGTATAEGDPTEMAALREVFGGHAPRLAVSSTKALHGHLLGAAGAIEAVITVLSLRQQTLVATAHLKGRLDPACEGVDHVLETRRGVPVRAALSSSFAFGGSNAVLAFRAVEPSA